MRNLKGYQIMTTVAKKVGGPMNLVICMAVTGYAIGKLVEIPIKVLKEKSSEKVYTVDTFGISDNGINLYPGDKFKVLEEDTEMAFIEIVGEVYNQYFEKESNRKTIRQKLLQIFGDNAGYAQQYLFYSQRSDKNNIN